MKQAQPLTQTLDYEIYPLDKYGSTVCGLWEYVWSPAAADATPTHRISWKVNKLQKPFKKLGVTLIINGERWVFEPHFFNGCTGLVHFWSEYARGEYLSFFVESVHQMLSIDSNARFGPSLQLHRRVQSTEWSCLVLLLCLLNGDKVVTILYYFHYQAIPTWAYIGCIKK